MINKKWLLAEILRDRYYYSSSNIKIIRLNHAITSYCPKHSKLWCYNNKKPLKLLNSDRTAFPISPLYCALIMLNSDDNILFELILDDNHFPISSLLPIPSTIPRSHYPIDDNHFPISPWIPLFPSLPFQLLYQSISSTFGGFTGPITEPIIDGFTGPIIEFIMNDYKTKSWWANNMITLHHAIISSHFFTFPTPIVAVKTKPSIELPKISKYLFDIS